MSLRDELHELEVFGRWVEDEMPSPPPPPELLDARYVSRSQEVMPDELCDRLKVPRGWPYESGFDHARMAYFTVRDGWPGTIEDFLIRMQTARDAETGGQDTPAT